MCCKGPKLPFKIVGHCIVKYQEDKIFLIGGRQNGLITNQVWILNPFNGIHKKGPVLNEKREDFACGKMEKNGTILLIVAGGHDSSDKYFEDNLNNSLDTVEILDPLSEIGWTLGV